MRRLTLFLLTALIVISLAAAAAGTAQQVHVVQRGENLFRIALTNNRTVDQLARANGISPPYVIHAGNEITIPARVGVTRAPAQEPDRAETGGETHCYIIGDVCVIISNVCFLDFYDCGDGRTWESQRAWKRGWCMAAIYAGVIEGTVQQCVEVKARTVAERALISSVNGMPVIWQHQQFQVQQSRTNGYQQSNTGGAYQQSSSNGGGSQRGVGQTGGNQQQEQPLIVLQSENPPPDQQPKIPDQQGQEDLLLQILKQQEPQYQQAQGPQGEQQPDKQGGHPSDSYPDCEHDPLIKSEKRRGQYVRSYKEVPCIDRNPPDNRVEDEDSHTVSGPGNVNRPNYKPLVPESGQCRAEVNCYNCSWQMEVVYGTKGKTKDVRVCKVKGEDPCTAYDEYTINLSETPASTTWKYVCT